MTVAEHEQPRRPARRAGRAVAGLARDVGRLFVRPRSLPPAAHRAQVVADTIDWSAPTVLLWVPGTNVVGVPPQLDQCLREAHPGIVAHVVDYMATWQLRDSLPDGELVLRELLQIVARRRRRDQHVVLLGQSQGAWVISSVLQDAKLAAVVDRVALVAHPAIAPAHAHDCMPSLARLDDHVREFNAPGDVVSYEVDCLPDHVLDLVDAIARKDARRAVGEAARIVASDRMIVRAFLASQLFRVRGTDNPHESEHLMRDAVAWLLEEGA
jgi:hypothetical protein